MLAQANDSFSGKATYARITDAALSTLAFERQARVAAQLPTGRVVASSKADENKAQLLNVILNRYILPNADSQHPMLIKLRLWGVYASVYGSMPMFYDYRVDDRYIGPECYLVDPRNFAIQPGFSSVQDADYAFVSNDVATSMLKNIAKKEKTTWNKPALNKIIKLNEANKAKPSKDNDSQKQSVVEQQRYDKSQATGRIELVTKYESGEAGHWITFAPDYDNIIVRDIPNPHKSGRIPIVMRHCFPLLNSIFGLGDYERGMRLQKAKDSLTNLFLEGAKNRIFPPLKINRSLVTESSIENKANSRWYMTDINLGAAPVQYGNQALGEFQASWGSLQSMLMNQFGTTDTSISQQDSGNPAFGKTPQALQQLQQRQNARDTWDMFMHEQATQELEEGMLNLLTVKMEKPINFAVFEEDIKLLGKQYGKDKGLQAFSDGKSGKMTVNKSQVSSNTGYAYLIDANSSMSQNAQEQFNALKTTWDFIHSDPNAIATVQSEGYNYDEGEHLKAAFIAAGVSNWDKILQEKDKQQQQQSDSAAAQGQPGQPPIDPQMMQQLMQMQGQAGQQMPGQAPAKPPSESINYKDAPPDIKAQMEQQAGLQPSATHQAAVDTTMTTHAMQQNANMQTVQQQQPGMQQQMPQPQQNQPNFEDPQIAALAQQLMSGAQPNG